MRPRLPALCPFGPGSGGCVCCSCGLHCVMCKAIDALYPLQISTMASCVATEVTETVSEVQDRMRVVMKSIQDLQAKLQAANAKDETTQKQLQEVEVQSKREKTVMKEQVAGIGTAAAEAESAPETKRKKKAKDEMAATDTNSKEAKKEMAAIEMPSKKAKEEIAGTEVTSKTKKKAKEEMAAPETSSKEKKKKRKEVEPQAGAGEDGTLKERKREETTAADPVKAPRARPTAANPTIPKAEVVLRNCDRSITDEHVREHFADLGPKAITKIMWHRKTEGGPVLGLGFVRFATKELALRAATEFKRGLQVGKRQVVIELNTPVRERGKACSEDPAGEVVVGKAHRDKDLGPDAEKKAKEETKTNKKAKEEMAAPETSSKEKKKKRKEVEPQAGAGEDGSPEKKKRKREETTATEPPTNKAEVILRNCDRIITDEHVREHFADLGPKAITRIMWHRRTRDGPVLGLGFVRFATQELALRAVTEFKDGLQVGQRRVVIELATPDRERRKSCSEDPACEVFVGNAHWDMTDEDIYTHFADLGPDAVKRIRWSTLPNGTFRGFGFVEFKDRATAERAVQDSESAPLVKNGRKCNLEIRQSIRAVPDGWSKPG